MKLNKSFLFNTVSTITVLISATLSAHAEETNKYAQYQRQGSQGELKAAVVADSDGVAPLVGSSDQKFSSQQIAGELALGILLMMVCYRLRLRFN